MGRLRNAIIEPGSGSLRRSRLTLALLGALAASCYDFHLTGPEDAPTVTPPQSVSVTIEYRQPIGCLSSPSPHCDEPVVFFATWMPTGAQLILTRLAGTQVWQGRAVGVPVNYPPRDEPYQVRIYDPYLVDSCAQGFSADRIVVGSEALTQTIGGGCRDQAALVYVDANGQGHNPY